MERDVRPAVGAPSAEESVVGGRLCVGAEGIMAGLPPPRRPSAGHAQGPRGWGRPVPIENWA